MASYEWMKLYHEILNDPKMGRLPDNVWRRCIELFLLASQQDERDGQLPDIDDIAFILRVSDEQLHGEIEHLIKVGIVEQRDGVLYIKNFVKRQKAISGAERIKKYRERQKKARFDDCEINQYEMESPRDETIDETELKHHGNDDVTQPVTNRYTDKELDKDKESPPLPPPMGGRVAQAPRATVPPSQNGQKSVPGPELEAIKTQAQEGPGEECVNLQEVQEDSTRENESVLSEKPKTKTRTKRKKKQPVFVVPESLDTPEFNAVWFDFQQHRREIKKPMTQIAGDRLLKRLTSVGLLESIARIERSIENGWQGLFFPDDSVHYQNIVDVTGSGGDRNGSQGLPFEPVYSDSEGGCTLEIY